MSLIDLDSPEDSIHSNTGSYENFTVDPKYLNDTNILNDQNTNKQPNFSRNNPYSAGVNTNNPYTANNANGNVYGSPNSSNTFGNSNNTNIYGSPNTPPNNYNNTYNNPSSTMGNSYGNTSPNFNNTSNPYGPGNQGNSFAPNGNNNFSSYTPSSGGYGNINYSNNKKSKALPLVIVLLVTVFFLFLGFVIVSRALNLDNIFNTKPIELSSYINDDASTIEKKLHINMTHETHTDYSFSGFSQYSGYVYKNKFAIIKIGNTNVLVIRNKSKYTLKKIKIGMSKSQAEDKLGSDFEIVDSSASSTNSSYTDYMYINYDTKEMILIEYTNSDKVCIVAYIYNYDDFISDMYPNSSY